MSIAVPTLVSLQRDLCCIEVIEGETDDLKRQLCESSLIEQLHRSGVLLQSLEISAAGCFVVVDCADAERLKAIVRPFNVAIRVHEPCARIVFRRATTQNALPTVAAILGALHRESIRTVQVVADDAQLSVLVDAANAVTAGHVCIAGIARRLPLPYAEVPRSFFEEHTLSNIKDALDNARSEAQALHRNIEATTAKDHAVLRADLQSAAAQAHQLAESLKVLHEGQQADAKQHLKDAAAQLEDAAKHARDLSSAGDAQLKQTGKIMLAKARDAVQNLSHAVAERRSKTAKVAAKA